MKITDHKNRNNALFLKNQATCYLIFSVQPVIFLLRPRTPIQNGWRIERLPNENLQRFTHIIQRKGYYEHQ